MRSQLQQNSLRDDAFTRRILVLSNLVFGGPKNDVLSLIKGEVASGTYFSLFIISFKYGDFI